MIKVLLLSSFLTGCGFMPERVIERPVWQENPVPVDPVTPGTAPTWAQTKLVTDQHCNVSGCHSGAGFLATEQGFINSNSKLRVQNGTMPPSSYGGNWTPADKQVVMDFFDSVN